MKKYKCFFSYDLKIIISLKKISKFSKKKLDRIEFYPIVKAGYFYFKAKNFNEAQNKAEKMFPVALNFVKNMIKETL